MILSQVLGGFSAIHCEQYAHLQWVLNLTLGQCMAATKPFTCGVVVEGGGGWLKESSPHNPSLGACYGTSMIKLVTE